MTKTLNDKGKKDTHQKDNIEKKETTTTTTNKKNPTLRSSSTGSLKIDSKNIKTTTKNKEKQQDGQQSNTLIKSFITNKTELEFNTLTLDPKRVPEEVEKKWGTFCFENNTQNPIYFGLKGLHVVWEIEPILSPQCFERMYLLKHEVDKTYQPYMAPPDSSKKIRYDASGQVAWKNCLRYMLHPQSYVLGRFPFQKYKGNSILVVEFQINEEDDDNIQSQTAIFSENNLQTNNLTDVLPSPIKSEVNHGIIDLPEELTDDNNILYRSYVMEHKQQKDIILEATSSKSLFSSHIYYSIHPVTYTFYSKHNPCGLTKHSVSLVKNLVSSEFNAIVVDQPKAKGKQETQKNVNEEMQTLHPIEELKKKQIAPLRPTSSPHGALALSAFESLNRQRESILFLLSFLNDIKEKIPLVVFHDDTYKDLPLNPMDYCMKNLIQMQHHKTLKKWFYSNFSTLYIHEDSELYLRPSESPSNRCLQLYDRVDHGYDNEFDTNTLEFRQLVAGMLILHSVNGPKISNALKKKLRILEGFPILFMLYGLEKCDDIYHALQKKERVEEDIYQIFSASHKPYILTCYNRPTEKDNATVCSFKREVVDIMMTHIIAKKPRVVTTKIINQVLKRFSKKNDSSQPPSPSKSRRSSLIDQNDFEKNIIETHDEGDNMVATLRKSISFSILSDKSQSPPMKKKKTIWFFGIDNERESALLAYQMVHLEGYRKVLCCSSREDITANQFRSLLSQSSKVVMKSWNHVSHFLKFGEKSISPIKGEDSLVLEHSDSTLSSLNESMKESNEFSQAQLSMERTIINEASSLPSTPTPTPGTSKTQHSDFIHDSSLLFNTTDDDDDIVEEVQWSGFPAIQKDDIFVFCIELSTRVLICGPNGIYTSFLTYVKEMTDNCVLFVDRLDIKTDSLSKSIISNPSDSTWDSCNNLTILERGQFIYGDENDLHLDLDLQQTQEIETYFKSRFYYYGPRDTQPEYQKAVSQFWQRI
mmetsp:Transcript_339/g.617  ORF Transcript_339/g.617 Transcript_339/m.617 type:complete len:984 (+) Transcript_339:67-3018(+)